VTATKSRGVIVATVPECVTEAVRLAAQEANIVVLQGLHDAVVALDAAAWLATHHANEAPASVEIATSTQLINEADAKSLLQKNGISVPSGKKCTRDAVLEIANQIGYPITLKGLGLAHKSESGAVKVGLQSEIQIVDALSSMPVSISEFLVEQTIVNVVAEILVSVRRDAPVGWLITLGAGGIYTELWHDTTFLLAPVSDSAIKAALTKLRIAPLLAGYRGKPAGNVNALIKLIQSVINTAITNDLVEIELNPVLVTPETAIAVDALMVASI
jgi:acyl-CoA synthetase (NDP forming)